MNKFIEKHQDAPELTVPHCGHTGYIDYLEADDMSAPVMKGTDPEERRFVAFLVRVVDTDAEFGGVEHSVFVLHERYSDNSSVVVLAGRGVSEFFPGGKVTEEGHGELLRKLATRERLSGRRVTMSCQLVA